jgi:hypothetical protein
MAYDSLLALRAEEWFGELMYLFLEECSIGHPDNDWDENLYLWGCDSLEKHRARITHEA